MKYGMYMGNGEQNTYNNSTVVVLIMNYEMSTYMYNEQHHVFSFSGGRLAFRFG